MTKKSSKGKMVGTPSQEWKTDVAWLEEAPTLQSVEPGRPGKWVSILHIFELDALVGQVLMSGAGVEVFFEKKTGHLIFHVVHEADTREAFVVSGEAGFLEFAKALDAWFVLVSTEHLDKPEFPF